MIGGDIVSPVSVLYDNFGKPIPLSLDAFQRLRISQPSTLFDSKQIYDSQPLYWTTSVSGTGSITYQPQRSSSSLAVVNNGDIVIRQTKRYFSYQPGKSFLVLATFVFTSGAQSNVTKRLGYFDLSNGIYLELNDSNLSLVIRSDVSGSVSNNSIPRASWDDPLNGTGPSKKTLALDKSQIFFCDFEWLGVGSVRVGLIIDGQFVVAHTFKNANNASSVYMRTPNLPVRYECISTGGAGSLESICSSIISEGGLELIGTQRSVVNGGASIPAGATQQLLAIRNKDNEYLHTPIFPRKSSVSCSSTGSGIWRLHINPTVTGTFTPISVPNSAIEYDTSRTAITASGVEIAAGSFSGSTSQIEDIIREQLTLGVSLTNVRDELVLSVTNTNNTPETYYGSLSWNEPN